MSVMSRIFHCKKTPISAKSPNRPVNGYLSDPHATSFVEWHGEWIDDLAFAGHTFDGKALGHGHQSECLDGPGGLA